MLFFNYFSEQVIEVSILNKLCYKGAWLLGRGLILSVQQMNRMLIGCKANVPDYMYNTLREFDAGKAIGISLQWSNHGSILPQLMETVVQWLDLLRVSNQ